MYIYISYREKGERERSLTTNDQYTYYLRVSKSFLAHKPTKDLQQTLAFF